MLYTALQQPVRRPCVIRAARAPACDGQARWPRCPSARARSRNVATGRQAHRDSGVRHDGRAALAAAEELECDGGQHAFREADRRRTGARTRANARCDRDRRRRRGDGWRGLGVRRGAGWRAGIVKPRTAISGCPTASSITAIRPSCWRACGLDAAGIASRFASAFSADRSRGRPAQARREGNGRARRGLRRRSNACTSHRPRSVTARDSQREAPLPPRRASRCASLRTRT